MENIFKNKKLNRVESFTGNIIFSLILTISFKRMLFHYNKNHFSIFFHEIVEH